MPLLSSLPRLPGRSWKRRGRRNRMASRLALLCIILVVFLPLYFIYKPPSYVMNWLQNRFPQVLFHLPTSRKIVALTIDDAPSEYTRQILEILTENGVAATFFTIGGQVAGREEVLKDLILAGSELGNHAMHDEPSINLPSDTLRSEINEVDTLIDAAYASAGQTRGWHYFRPGSGIFSQRLLDVAKEEGYMTILGSIYPHDPFVSYAWLNAWHILSSLRPGAVIICHDRRPWTVPMLRKVVPEIKRRGFEVVTITGLLNSEAKP